MQSWLFKNRHVVKLEALVMLANDSLKLNYAIITCLININVVAYGVM